MELSNALIYSMRFVDKLILPKVILDSISKLRLIPATYRPNRPKAKFVPRPEVENWRTSILMEVVRKVRETDDADYDEIFAIFNKIAAPTLDKLSGEALDILAKRDENFRLRVSTLLFDKAIKGSVYAALMTSFALKINQKIPEFSEDLETHVQMFTKIYDMNDTLLFPKIEDPEFENKVVAWSKQKDIRRGYARFLTHLYTKNLVTAKPLQESMQRVLQDLKNTITEPKAEQSEENVTQFADFLFEIAKILNPTAVELRGLIFSQLSEILARPRAELPSLNMRSRFKLEDTVKCVK